MTGGVPGLVDRAVLVSHRQGLHLSPAEVITCKSRSSQHPGHFEREKLSWEVQAAQEDEGLQ